MALDYIPRGDLKTPKDIGAQVVTTWPIKNTTMPQDNNGKGKDFPAKTSKLK